MQRKGAQSAPVRHQPPDARGVDLRGGSPPAQIRGAEACLTEVRPVEVAALSGTTLNSNATFNRATLKLRGMALRMNAQIRSPLWIAHTQHDYADMLLHRSHPGHRDKALQLLDEALTTAEQLGLKAPIRRNH
jgi:hypothetical protein